MIDLSKNGLSLVLDITEGGALIIKSFGKKAGIALKPATPATEVFRYLKDIDMVVQNLETGQGVCGSSSGSVPTDVGQPLIRVKEITVGGR